MSHVNLRRVKYGRYVSLAAKINLIYLLSLCVTWGYISVSILLPLGGSDSRVCSQCGRTRFDPWFGKIPWKREWQPTTVFLPGKSHEWRRSLAGYIHTMRLQRVGHDWMTLLSFSSYCPQDYNACFFVKVFVFHDFFFFTFYWIPFIWWVDNKCWINS